VADKKEKKIDKPDPALRKDQPKVLSQQRATVIEIITNRIKKPVADIKKAIIAGDKKELTFEMLNELKSLFPVKPEAFEEEKNSLERYPNKAELTKMKLYYSSSWQFQE